MKRLPSSGLTGVFVSIVLVALSASALAYFSPQGVGTASAGVGKLLPPTITTSTPAAGGTVSLAWSAVTAPDATAVKYYVSRDGGNPAGTCAAPAVPAAATSCKDSEVPLGEHTYTVTAVWRTWSATSATASAKITVGAPTHFTLAASTETPAVAGSVNLTIAAKDENESTVTTYTGAHSLVFAGAASSPSGSAATVVNSAGTAVAFGTATALSFTTGVASVSSSKNGLLKIYRSGPAEVTAREGTTILTTSPLKLTVAAGAATKFTLAAVTTTPVAGAADDLTITANDTYGNVASTYTGAHQLVFSGASASPGGTLPTVTDASGATVPFGTATTIEFKAGVAATVNGTANGEMTLFKSGATSITATEETLKNTTALALTVAAAGAANFLLGASTATPVAAGSFNLTTTARDAYGNTATSYTGVKTLTFAGAALSPAGTAPTVVNSAGTAIAFGAATALTFTSGVAAVTSSKNGLARLYKVETANLTVSDGTISTTAPLALTVAAGAAARLGLTAVEVSAGTIGSPCLFTCTITALGNNGLVSASISVTDSAGNTVANLGSGHTVKATATGGIVTGGTALTIAAAGPAVSETRFTYTSPVSGTFTNTITAAATVGTVYTAATATATK